MNNANSSTVVQVVTASFFIGSSNRSIKWLAKQTCEAKFIYRYEKYEKYEIYKFCAGYSNFVPVNEHMLPKILYL